MADGSLRSDGYECQEAQENDLAFRAEREDRMKIFVTIAKSIGLFTIVSYYRMKRSRRDGNPRVRGR